MLAGDPVASPTWERRGPNLTATRKATPSACRFHKRKQREQSHSTVLKGGSGYTNVPKRLNFNHDGARPRVNGAIGKIEPRRRDDGGCPLGDSRI